MLDRRRLSALAYGLSSAEESASVSLLTLVARVGGCDSASSGESAVDLSGGSGAPCSADRRFLHGGGSQAAKGPPAVALARAAPVQVAARVLPRACSGGLSERFGCRSDQWRLSRLFPLGRDDCGDFLGRFRRRRSESWHDRQRESAGRCQAREHR